MTSEITFDSKTDPKRVHALTRIAREFVMHDQQKIERAVKDLDALGIKPTRRFSLEDIAVILHQKIILQRTYDQIAPLFATKSDTADVTGDQVRFAFTSLGMKGHVGLRKPNGKISPLDGFTMVAQDGTLEKPLSAVSQLHVSFLMTAWKVKPHNGEGVRLPDIGTNPDIKNECRFPMPVIPNKDFERVCGNAQQSGSCYCPGHHQIATVPLSVAEERKIFAIGRNLGPWRN